MTVVHAGHPDFRGFVSKAGPEPTAPRRPPSGEPNGGPAGDARGGDDQLLDTGEGRALAAAILEAADEIESEGW